MELRRGSSGDGTCKRRNSSYVSASPGHRNDILFHCLRFSPPESSWHGPFCRLSLMLVFASARIPTQSPPQCHRARDENCVSCALCACLRLPEHHHEESLICDHLIRARKNCCPRQQFIHRWRQRTAPAKNTPLSLSSHAAGSSCHITNPIWVCFSPIWPAR